MALGDGRDWLSQARRGVVELAVLFLIRRAPRYGYELAVALSEWKPLAAPEGTLYPLLRRLQRDELIRGEWVESREGPPRKYYRLTNRGEALLTQQLDEWDCLIEAVDELRSRREAPAEKPA
jgi:PadR family transcriptional regulator PadR